MIKAADLRLGNLLIHKGEVVYVTTLTLDIDDEREESIGFCKVGQATDEVICWDRSLNLQGIEITPDWLERCGFNWDEENQVCSIQIGNALYLEYDKAFDCAITPEDRPGSSGYLWGENKSVHQLQNLYYRLTGKELEIKLP